MSTTTTAAGTVVVEDRFACMGSEAHVVLTGADPGALEGLPELARARIDRLERIWSRFIADSELSLLNASPGRWHDVSDETFELVRRGLAARRATAGRFDPTMLDAVVAAGYTSSLAPVDVGPVDVMGAPHAPGVRRRSGRAGSDGAGSERAGGEHDGSCGVELDPSGRRVRVRPGCGFDPGGIGKGFASDLVVDELIDAGAGGACVNIGGDLRVAGAPPGVPVGTGWATAPADGVGSWVVGVEDPRDPSGPVLRRLSLLDGAVATSSRCRRRWRREDGSEAHHLIDPSTREPATGEVLTATVVAARGWIAEALATAAFLEGSQGAAPVVADLGATGVLVTSSGVVELPGLDAFLLR
ncbi:MAG: FAD:protein FMN transferase [Actinobacteria bacterium]|nr:FAD:protein FMN transferase [Actinomycetota bacterium]